MIEYDPKIRVICGNKKCRELNVEPVLEINFFTKDIVYICPKCGEESKFSLFKEARPFPKTRVR